MQGFDVIDRRSFLESAMGSTMLGLGTSPRPIEEGGDGRPTFDAQLIDSDHWRVRSWEWDADSEAWRPVIGYVRRTAGGFRMEGRIAEGGELALAAWLEAQQGA